MGPDTTDFVFIGVGSFMAIAGCVLYFVLELWPRLKGTDPTIPAAVPVLITFGGGCLANGLLVGYALQMPVWLGNALTVIMVVNLVACAFALYKLVKLQRARPTLN